MISCVPDLDISRGIVREQKNRSRKRKKREFKKKEKEGGKKGEQKPVFTLRFNPTNTHSSTQLFITSQTYATESATTIPTAWSSSDVLAPLQVVKHLIVILGRTSPWSQSCYAKLLNHLYTNGGLSIPVIFTCFWRLHLILSSLLLSKSALGKEGICQFSAPSNMHQLTAS